MQKIRKAGIGRNKINIRANGGRVTVYRSNNTNKPFKKPIRRGQSNAMRPIKTRFGPLPTATSTL